MCVKPHLYNFCDGDVLCAGPTASTQTSNKAFFIKKQRKHHCIIWLNYQKKKKQFKLRHIYKKI